MAKANTLLGSVLAAVLLFDPLAAVAKPVAYYCTMQGGTFVAPDMVLVFGAETDTVLVMDGLLKKFNGNKPMKARISTDNAKRTSFGWNVKDVRAQGESVDVVFTATFLKASREIQVRARPGSYDNTFSGQGKCKLDTQAP